MYKTDQGACLRALVSLANAEHRDLLAFLTVTDVAGCVSLDCHGGRLVALRDLNNTRSILNPLDAFYDRWNSYSKSVCGSCYRESTTMYNIAREVLWQSLPEIFDLPRWEKLEEMKREALSKP